MIHFPLRSFSVLSAGAAMLASTDSEWPVQDKVEEIEGEEAW